MKREKKSSSSNKEKGKVIKRWAKGKAKGFLDLRRGETTKGSEGSEIYLLKKVKRTALQKHRVLEK